PCGAVASARTRTRVQNQGRERGCYWWMRRRERREAASMSRSSGRSASGDAGVPGASAQPEAFETRGPPPWPPPGDAAPAPAGAAELAQRGLGLQVDHDPLIGVVRRGRVVVAHVAPRRDLQLGEAIHLGRRQRIAGVEEVPIERLERRAVVIFAARDSFERAAE